MSVVVVSMVDNRLVDCCRWMNGLQWVSYGFCCINGGQLVSYECCCYLEYIGHVARMSVSGYRGLRFEPWHQYVVSLSKTVYPYCFSRFICEMSSWWGQPHEGCSVLCAFRRNST